MCSLHCRCMEGRKLKVSCVAKHPPQVYSCSWISCLSAPHSTSWSRLEFFCPLGVSGKEGWSQSGYFLKGKLVINSMGFWGILQVIVIFFLGKMMKNDDRKPRWILGFSIFNKGPRGCLNSGRSCCPCLAALLSSCPVWFLLKAPLKTPIPKGLLRVYGIYSMGFHGNIMGYLRVYEPPAHSFMRKFKARMGFVGCNGFVHYQKPRYFHRGFSDNGI